MKQRYHCIDTFSRLHPRILIKSLLFDYFVSNILLHRVALVSPKSNESLTIYALFSSTIISNNNTIYDYHYCVIKCHSCSWPSPKKLPAAHSLFGSPKRSLFAASRRDRVYIHYTVKRTKQKKKIKTSFFVNTDKN